MATVYSEPYSTGTYTYTRVRVDYSGTSATAHLLYTRTNDYAPATTTEGATFTFGGQTTNFTASVSGAQTDYEVASVAFTISTSGGTYSGSTGGSPGPGLFAFSGSVSIPAQSTPPSGLSISAPYNITAEGATFDVSVSSYGDPSSATGRWLEAGILGSGAWGNPGRSERALNVSSATITVNNNSTRLTSLSIAPNTTYHYGLYAYNTVTDNNTVPGTFTTAPAQLASVSVAQSGATATVSYSTSSDGGAASKAIQYSTDGSTWTTGDTVSTGQASSGTFSFTIPAGTSTLYFRALGSVAGEVTQISLSEPRLYGSVGGQAKQIKKLYASVSQQVNMYTGTIRQGSAGDFTAFDGSVFSYHPDILAIQGTISYVFGRSDAERGGYLRAVLTDTTTISLFDYYETSKTFAEYGITCTGETESVGYIDLTATQTTANLSKEVKKLYGSVGGQTKLIYEA